MYSTNSLQTLEERLNNDVKLDIPIIVDECVQSEVPHYLRKLGFEKVTYIPEERAGFKDKKIKKRADRYHAIVISRDHHFKNYPRAIIVKSTDSPESMYKKLMDLIKSESRTFGYVI